MTPMQRVDVLRAACCVACSDGAIADQELGLVSRLAKEVGVGQASLTAMIERSMKDPKFSSRTIQNFERGPKAVFGRSTGGCNGRRRINGC